MVPKGDKTLKSSLLHFLITFVIAFAVFGILAYTYYDSLVSKIPTGVPQESEDSAAVSETVSGEQSSGYIIEIPDSSTEDEEPGKRISGLLIFKDAEGFVSEARYLRINEKKKVVVICNFPTTVSLYNSVGALIPISDYFAMVPGEQAARDVVALTGAPADFYIEMDVESIRAALKFLSNCTFHMDRVIDYVNPIYEDYVPAIEGEFPEDYRKRIDAGEIELTEETLDTLLEYHKLQIEAGKPNDIRPILNEMYESICRAVVISQKATYRDNAKGVMGILSGARTNLSEPFLKEYGELLFSYGDFYHNEIPFTTHDVTLHKIKEADA